ncbi:hypothetical protein CHUAL_005401 [Chamberlinius hualienensis]
MPEMDLRQHKGLLYTFVIINCLVIVQSYDFDVYYYTQKVDHFSFANGDTFQQKYLINDTWWEGNNGPIFFYTGNEGSVGMFAQNTGILFDWAPEFKALIVFSEHRYYGESMPYGNQSYDLDKLGWLNSEQALADYTELVVYIKNTFPGAKYSPVIAFGGSYGGMLAAWGRIKYPHIYAGALASSAPIWSFEGLTPCGDFYKIVTKDFADASPVCADTIRASWDAMFRKAQTSDGLQWMSDTFKLCSPVTNQAQFETMVYWFMNAWTNLAMVNYPYAANFLEPLPAWPVNAACGYLNGTYVNDDQILQAIADAAFFYYNYTGQSPCIDIFVQASPDLGDAGWAYQACTEMIMPFCSDGINDMFFPTEWNLTAYDESCKAIYQSEPRPFMTILEYGGKNITAASNIIFSNGNLDPWSSGGVLSSLSDSLISLYMDQSAHHLDIRSANPDDPESVVNAREIEKWYISSWINGELGSPKHAKFGKAPNFKHLSKPELKSNSINQFWKPLKSINRKPLN